MSGKCVGCELSYNCNIKLSLKTRKVIQGDMGEIKEVAKIIETVVRCKNYQRAC